MGMLTIEELQDSDTLCEYCPIPEEHQGVKCYGGVPILCEGSQCVDAYENYVDDYEDSHEVHLNLVYDIDAPVSKISLDFVLKHSNLKPKKFKMEIE